THRKQPPDSARIMNPVSPLHSPPTTSNDQTLNLKRKRKQQWKVLQRHYDTLKIPDPAGVDGMLHPAMRAEDQGIEEMNKDNMNDDALEKLRLETAVEARVNGLILVALGNVPDASAGLAIDIPAVLGTIEGAQVPMEQRKAQEKKTVEVKAGEQETEEEEATQQALEKALMALVEGVEEEGGQEDAKVRSPEVFETGFVTSNNEEVNEKVMTPLCPVDDRLRGCFSRPSALRMPFILSRSSSRTDVDGRLYVIPEEPTSLAILPKTTSVENVDPVAEHMEFTKDRYNNDVDPEDSIQFSSISSKSNNTAKITFSHLNSPIAPMPLFATSIENSLPSTTIQISMQSKREGKQPQGNYSPQGSSSSIRSTVSLPLENDSSENGLLLEIPTPSVLQPLTPPTSPLPQLVRVSLPSSTDKPNPGLTAKKEHLFKKYHCKFTSSVKSYVNTYIPSVSTSIFQAVKRVKSKSE
ncbi:hypothetical protein RUND412_008780, partial [Rhizina undulata]